MKNIIFFFLIFIFYQTILSKPLCKVNKDYCEKCNPINNLCIQCLFDTFYPNEEGGCSGKCFIGKNYCIECDNEEKLCQKCEDGFYQDEVGGCTITQNCEISYKGKCEQCKEGYILVGEENHFKICKNLNSDDLKNCKKINYSNGLCDACEDGFFKNKGDSKCSNIENCYESIYGVCNSCIAGYYLNAKNGICQKVENKFFNCKQTIDEINCDKCNKNYYLSEDLQCTDTNFCSKTKINGCKECIQGYKLLQNGSCSKEDNCKIADKDTGLCNSCLNGYYLDNKDKKCKSNREDNENKYCEIYDEGCIKCENEYFISEDLKCVKTRGCAESDNGKCLKCSEGYFMGLDNNCSTVEHCIYSGKNIYYGCDECEPNYCYNIFSKECFLIEEEKFNNCQQAYGTRCSLCHKNFYLNATDSLCYDNTNENDIFYKCEKTDFYGKNCFECEDSYYLGMEDYKCSKIENCKISENENICKECIEYYCLDVKKQKCVENDFLENEEDKIYLNCNRTNEEGDKCEECLKGYEVGEEGYCIDVERCLEKKDGICEKCRNIDDGGYGQYYCANTVFGCINTFISDCIRCDNLLDLFSCTECEEGYEINEYGLCIDSEIN